ncbi:MAG: hypothetical protein JWM34_3380 [Ilumatobacteraceae bacterium]|nr:hypothetical protein [Ilumatobacteraceae bacterium]
MRNSAVRVFFSPAYCDTTVAFDTTRKSAAVAVSLASSPVPGVSLEAPGPLRRDELTAVHADAYVDAVSAGVPRELATSNELAWDPKLFAAASASVAGVRDAALHAYTAGTIAGSLSSGLHHAYADRGRGYCTFNGLVVAARAAMAAGAERVLVLDLDAHCGGGTASLIRDIPEIEQVDVSVDVFDMYESRTLARLTLCGGSDYLAVVAREIGRIETPEAIDLVLYNAGMDPHEHAGGCPGITADTLRERERMVFAWAAANQLPVAWVLAGGYTAGNEGAALDMEGLVALHRTTVETAAQSLGGYDAAG